MQLEAKTIIQGDSVGWLVWHDTDGNGTLADLSSGYTCQIVVGGTAINRTVATRAPAYDGAAADTAFVAGLTLVETAALAVGQYVVSVKLTNTTVGFSGEQHGILTVESSAPVLALPTEVDELQADLDAVNAAIRKFMAGEFVKDVWRDGRRIVRENPSYRNLLDHRDLLKREIAAATAVQEGGTTRRAIRLGWSI